MPTPPIEPASELPIEPPVVPVRPHQVSSPFGERSDPYYWLRDDTRTDRQVLAHLEAENAYHARYMARLEPLEEKIYAEILARLKQDDSTVPYRKNGYWYYVRFEPGKEHPLFARRLGSMAAIEQVMLDANELATGHDYYEIGKLSVSPDGTWLAFCDDTVGRRQYVLRFKNLVTGEILTHSVPDVEADLAWANDNRTVLYVEKDPETLLGLKVRKHLVGSDAAVDPLVFEQTDKTLYTGVSKSKSERFLFIHMAGTLTSEWRYAEASDPDLRFKVFLPRAPDHEYDIEHIGDRFVVRTNRDAPNFRLVTVPIGRERSPDEWRELVAHREDEYIEDFDVFAEFVALSVRSGGRRMIAIKPLTLQYESAMQPNTATSVAAVTAGATAHRFIAGDEPTYAMYISSNPELDSPLLRYSYSSLTTPTTVYDYDMRTGVRTLLKRDPVLGNYDPADYETELRFATARDGKQIPVSLVHRKDFVRNGTAPLLQYAYGAYGFSTDPVFSSARFSLIDRGLVFVIAHIRGGQEMGRAWYDGGRLLQKKNSFTDFVDVTHFLVKEGYAARDKVCAMGGSAGGLAMGAIANSNAADYRGIVAQVPFVDVVTTMLDDSIPLTTNEYDEWGNPENEVAYDYMLSYSPYDNVRAQPYPAMLVTTGLWDSQVQYFEPAKWVAKLRARKTDHHPLLLRVDMEAGHGGKSGRFQRYRETAMEYAFLLDLLGIRH